ncbi:MAG: methyltransferase, partial [Muribaculaceae bacterium]|nr:methyltransferase [Muribaculaceae bacterium]
MKVGTDGVLLGAWASIAGNPTSILDVGTGCGIIALMMAQRCPSANIQAIDIETNAIAEATENFNNSPWPDRLTCSLFDATDFAHATIQKFDLIISNPPFFAERTFAPDTSRAAARNQQSLSPEALFSAAAKLLSPEGSICVIYPASLSPEILAAASIAGLSPINVTDVITKEGSAPSRTLWQFSKNYSCGQNYNQTITLRDDTGKPTDEYTS